MNKNKEQCLLSIVLCGRNDNYMGHFKYNPVQDILNIFKVVSYFTGFTRYAGEVAREQIVQTSQNVKELILMKEMVDEAINIRKSTEI